MQTMVTTCQTTCFIFIVKAVHAQHLMEVMGIIYIVPLALLYAVHKNRYN
ncbi:MAG: hypothetical protein ACMUEL_02610 [Flavobacteriales bacterium Tduv]